MDSSFCFEIANPHQQNRHQHRNQNSTKCHRISRLIMIISSSKQRAGHLVDHQHQYLHIISINHHQQHHQRQHQADNLDHHHHDHHHHDDHHHQGDDDHHHEEEVGRQQTNQSAPVESSANGPARFFSHIASFSKLRYIAI